MEGLDSGGNGPVTSAVAVYDRYDKPATAVILPGAPGAQARAGAREAPGPIAAAVAAKKAKEQGLPAPGGGGFTDVFVDLPAGTDSLCLSVSLSVAIWLLSSCASVSVLTCVRVNFGCRSA